MKLIIVFLVVVLFVWFMYPKFVTPSENFDSSDTEFVGVGAPQYDLRGEKLKTSCALKNYKSPFQQVRLNLYGSEMYASDYSPIEEGKKDCRKVKCPTYGNGYDNEDTCWTCGSLEHDKMYIPDIHPHVMN
jgi:hypothetical protein